MATKTVTMKDAEGLINNPAKSAFLVAATQYDRYRDDSGEWLQAWAYWKHGQAVAAVQHFDRHETELGEVLAIRSLQTQQIVQHVRIEQIQMIDGDEITEEDARDLGYESLDDFWRAKSKYRGKRVWLMNFQRVTAPSPDTIH